MPSTERILVPLAEGFEEIEFTAIVDILRRADLDVTVASLRPGPVKGAHGIAVVPDAALGQLDTGAFTALVVPGGQPGTRNLLADGRVAEIAKRLNAAGRPTAAICAAPTVLHAAGILQGKRATSHPSVRAALTGVEVVPDERVVRDGLVTTSQGAGTAIDFALSLVAQFAGEARAAELARAMVVDSKVDRTYV